MNNTNETKLEFKALQITDWAKLDNKQRQNTLCRPAMDESALLETQVRNIINQVKGKGDQALLELTKRFDGANLANLKIGQDQITQAIDGLSPKRLTALKQAYDQIQRFHAAQRQEDITVETCPGVICTLKTEAIESVGLYIPAGTAPLPSTVLMLGFLLSLRTAHERCWFLLRMQTVTLHQKYWPQLPFVK